MIGTVDANEAAGDALSDVAARAVTFLAMVIPWVGAALAIGLVLALMVRTGRKLWLVMSFGGPAARFEHGDEWSRPGQWDSDTPF